MTINEVWNMLEPYIVGFMQTGLGTALVYAISRLMMNKWFKKNDINNLVSGFASKLTGSTLNVDITAIAEKKLDKIDVKLSKKVADISQDINSLKHLIALVGGALSNSKTLSQEQKKALVEAVSAVEKGFIPPEEKEVVTIKLEEIPTRKIVTVATETAEGLINFDVLRGAKK